MKINIDPKKKKIVIRYGLDADIKKVLEKGQKLVESLPEYLLKISLDGKYKKDKENPDE